MSDLHASPSTSPNRNGLSLLAQALLWFVFVAVVPAFGVSVWLTGLYRGSVETTERQIQSAVLAELSSLSLRQIDDVQADAFAIASALGLAASESASAPDVELLLRSLLATRRTIRAARFEVPAANVSTVLRQSGVSERDAPKSTPALRAVADERRVAFSVSDASSALMVVPVPRVKPGAAAAYVTVKLDVIALGESLRTVAETRFNDKTAQLLIADGDHRVIASYGTQVPRVGEDSSSLAIWQVLPRGTTWARRISIVSEHVASGSPYVGGIETVPHLGWAVAVWRPKSAAYASLSALIPRFAIAAVTSLFLAMLVGVLAARTVSGPMVRLSQQAQLIGRRQWAELKLFTGRRDEIGELSRSMSSMARDLATSETQVVREAQLRFDLSRFMSPELVQSIVRGEHPLELGGKHATITVLFADIVSFTPLSETRPAEEVVSLLNEFFGLMSEIVFRHAGTVDKFIGDCIMAVWGAPVTQPDHAERALTAAEEMMRFLESGNEQWLERYGVELRVSIGVCSGSVIVGNIGSKKRMEYTVIGDVVNVAARLESIARPSQILVAEATKALVSDRFSFKSCGQQRLAGRTKPVEIHELSTD